MQIKPYIHDGTNMSLADFLEEDIGSAMERFGPEIIKTCIQKLISDGMQPDSYLANLLKKEKSFFLDGTVEVDRGKVLCSYRLSHPLSLSSFRFVMKDRKGVRSYIAPVILNLVARMTLGRQEYADYDSAEDLGIVVPGLIQGEYRGGTYQNVERGLSPITATHVNPIKHDEGLSTRVEGILRSRGFDERIIFW